MAVGCIYFAIQEFNDELKEWVTIDHPFRDTLAAAHRRFADLDRVWPKYKLIRLIEIKCLCQREQPKLAA